MPQPIRYEWDFNVDGMIDPRVLDPTYNVATETACSTRRSSSTDQGGRSVIG